MSYNFPKFQHLLLVCLMTAITGVAEAGSVQFSTYYPSPFGMYDRLRLVPRADLGGTCDAATQAGTLYVEEVTGALTYCNISGTWGPLAGGPWTQSGDNIYPSDTATNPNLTVGIGTTTPTPEAKLHLSGNSWTNLTLTTYNNSPVGSSIRPQKARGTQTSPASVQTGDWLGDLFWNSYNGASWGGAAGIMAKATTNGWGGELSLYTSPDGSSGSEERLTVTSAGNVGIGTTAPNNTLQVSGLVNFDDAKFSTSIGKSAGSVNTGNYNSFFGYQAGLANTAGNQNTASGYQALRSNTTGIRNTASGRAALYSNTSGSTNTACGTNALYSNTTGGGNTASGYQALLANTTGSENTASGNYALYSNTNGWHNTASGHEALSDNTIGNFNTASGTYALRSNTTGGDNTASGYYALVNNTTGIQNTASGAYALFSNTTGSQNTASGANALFNNTTTTTGSKNIAIGYNAGDNISSGSKNIIIGADIDAPSATASNQLSIGNLIFGTGLDGTGTTISTGNIGIGTTSPSAKLTVVTDNNEDSGWYSYNNTDGSDFDFYIYRARGTSAAPLAVTSANNLGGLNFMGYDGIDFEFGAHIQAYVDGTPGVNDMPGRLEFRTTPDGSNIQAVRMVIKNDGKVGIGTTTPDTVLHLKTSNNTELLKLTSNASAEIILEPQNNPANRYEFSAYDGNFSLSKTGSPTAIRILGATGRVGIGTDTPVFKFDVAGNVHATAFPVSSDLRFKEDIRPIEDVLEKLRKVRGVRFRWNDLHSDKLKRSNHEQAIGVIAQEVREVFPELVSEWGDSPEKYLAVDYSRMTAVLVEAVKAQQNEIEDLKARLAAIEEKLNGTP